MSSERNDPEQGGYLAPDGTIYTASYNGHGYGYELFEEKTDKFGRSFNLRCGRVYPSKTSTASIRRAIDAYVSKLDGGDWCRPS